MNAEDLRAYRSRWEAVGLRVRGERGSVEERLAQVAALMASVDAMGWRDMLSDDRPLWERWQRLRTLAGCGA